jgi:pyruvate kinase
MSVAQIARRIEARAVIVPTKSGATARRIAAFRLPSWIVAVSRFEDTCQALQFSFGVRALHRPDHPASWAEFARGEFAGEHGRIVLTEGTAGSQAGGTNRLEIIDL